MTKTPKITMLPCRTMYRHRKNVWSNVFPIEQLESQIKFYRQMAAKRPENYGPDLRALLLFQKMEVLK